MDSKSNDIIERYISLIESQGTINERFTNVVRIDPRGGDGVFSLVFKARDLESKKDRPVVLKFFNPLSNGNIYRLKCFSREIEILESLKKQRNILPIVYGKNALPLILKDEKTGIEFPIALEYYVSLMAERSIKSYIVEQPLDPLQSIIFFREMCKAVQRIHNKNICHRDIKPNNFLIYGKRYVCLSDFGAARYFNEKHVPMSLSYMGPVGDLGYTAPELACGLNSSHFHNCCADIYSLGTILFEMFSKVVLFDEIYNDQEYVIDLIIHFHKIQESNRQYLFDELIGGIAESKKLPSIGLYNDSCSQELIFHIDRLYQGMANLDYRKRIINFNEIFLKINICEKIIRNQRMFAERKRRKALKKM